jgi:hypothetical protein
VQYYRDLFTANDGLDTVEVAHRVAEFIEAEKPARRSLAARCALFVFRTKSPACTRIPRASEIQALGPAEAEKLRYDEAHGVYQAYSWRDTLYFVCPSELTVKKRGSLAREESFEEFSASGYIRKSLIANGQRRV